MSTRVLLIYFFKLFIEALSKNAVSQRTLTKVLAEILEEAKSDSLERLEKYRFDCVPDIQVESILSQNLKTFPIGYPSIERRISLAKGTSSNIFNSKSILPTFYHSISIALDTLSLYNDRENSATDAPSPDKEVSTPSKEGEPQLKEEENRKWNLDLASSQALKEIGDALGEFISSPDIPDAEKHEFINKATSHNVEIYKARQKGISFEESLQQKAQALKKKGEIFSQRSQQEKALQPPDLSEIPLYRGRQGRRRQVTPLDFLKIHYGQWLSSFGAEENKVYQDQIRAHDPDLIKGIDNQLRTEGKGRKVRDFVKTRSARFDRELENVSVEDLKKKRQLAGTLYSREKRAADKVKAAHSHSVTRK